MTMRSSIRRLWWLLRVAAHDWMWEGGSATETDSLRRAARRLPLYFSDPYWMPAEEFDRICREGGRVEVVGPPAFTTRWPINTSGQTWSTATASTWVWDGQAGDGWDDAD